MKKKDPLRHLKFVKAMAKINGRDVLPDVSLPKPKPTDPTQRKPRKTHTKTDAEGNVTSYKNKREEDAFRLVVIKVLRKNRMEVRRVEPVFRGKFGLGDLWVFCERTRWGGWVEIKTDTGTLNDDQEEVQRLCGICGVNYIIVRPGNDSADLICAGMAGIIKRKWGNS